MTTGEQARPAARRKIWIAACACACLLACGRHAKDAEEEGGAAAPAVVDVKLDSLIVGPVEEVVTAPGRTDVLRKETIASPVAGKVLALKVAEGATVRPGQVVAVVRTKESESALEGAQSLLNEARTEAARGEARRALELAQSTQTALSLRTKLGGVVASRLVQEGEQVAENESLMTIIDLSSLDFQADAPVAGIGRIRSGLSATVRLQSMAEDLPARVAAVLPQVQSASQTLSVRLQFGVVPATVRPFLKSDLAGEARIVVARREGALLAPKAALLRNDETGAYTLAVVGADSVARLVEVKPGAIQGDRQEIAAEGQGLKAGDKVAVQGQYGLADSTKVRPVSAEGVPSGAPDDPSGAPKKEP